MLFSTQLNLNITIQDINAIYATDYTEMLLAHARQLYAARCLDGQFIRSIDRVIQQSQPNLIRGDSRAKVRVFIKVLATVIRYDQHDVITGMEIQRIIAAGKVGDSDILQCNNDHAICFIRMQQDISDFNPGDRIMVRVHQSKYSINSKHILIDGYPFLPHVEEPVMYTFGKSTPELKRHFDTVVLPLIERELARKAAIDEKRWERIAQMLHPYKAKPTKARGADIRSIKAFENVVAGIDRSANMSDLVVKTLKPRNIPDDARVVDMAPTTAIMHLAFPFVKWLAVINDICEQYPTDADFDKIAYVWKLYVDSKL